MKARTDASRVLPRDGSRARVNGPFFHEIRHGQLHTATELKRIFKKLQNDVLSSCFCMEIKPSWYLPSDSCASVQFTSSEEYRTWSPVTRYSTFFRIAPFWIWISVINGDYHLKKLGASNRLDVSSRFLHLTEGLVSYAKAWILIFFICFFRFCGDRKNYKFAPTFSSRSTREASNQYAEISINNKVIKIKKFQGTDVLSPSFNI